MKAERALWSHCGSHLSVGELRVQSTALTVLVSKHLSDGALAKSVEPASSLYLPSPSSSEIPLINGAGQIHGRGSIASIVVIVQAQNALTFSIIAWYRGISDSSFSRSNSACSCILAHFRSRSIQFILSAASVQTRK